MAVKQVQSAARVLATFEALAHHQPVGVGALARVLDDDKSAVQRALMTLAEAGWIRRTPADDAQWEVSSHVLALAHGAQRRISLRERAHATLEALRDESGETTILSVADGGQVVVLDVVESNQLVRTVPVVGLVVPALTSAASQAILAHLPTAELAAFLGAPPESAFVKRLATVRQRGWSVNDRNSSPGASAVGAPILRADGSPLGSITISAPAERMPAKTIEALGAQVVAAARRLSALV